MNNALAQISGEVFDNSYSGTLSEYINDLLSAEPYGEFIEIVENDVSIVLSYTEAKKISENILLNLQRLDLPFDTKIIICADKAVDFVPIAWACIFGGFHFIPWTPLQLSRNKEAFSRGLSNLVESVTPAILITTHEISKKIENLVSGVPLYFKDDLARLKSPVEKKSVVVNEGEILVSSSGTTGNPKLIRINHSVFLNRGRKPKDKNSHTVLICLPLHSISGLAVLLPTAQKTIYVQPNYLAVYPEKFLRIIEQYKVKRSGLSPYIIQMILKSLEVSKRQYDLKCLTDFSVGSDFIYPDIIRNFAKMLDSFGSNCDISFVYGMTESGRICSSRSNFSTVKNNFSDQDGFANLGSCSPSMNLRVTNHNVVLNENEIGDIEIFSQYRLFTGYYGDKDSAFLEDGWFKTGDRGYIQNKELYITGRVKSRLITNTKKVELEVIERVLRKVKHLDNNQIFAQKVCSDDRFNDELLVYFVPDNMDKDSVWGISSEIKKILFNNFDILAKKITSIDARDIPRTSMGKVQQNILVKDLETCSAETTNKNAPENAYDDVDGFLAFLWIDILKLDKKPKLLDNFFELGADSLALTVFVAVIEKHYKITLVVEELLVNLDFVDICNLVKRKLAEQTECIPESGVVTETSFERIRKVETIVAAWKGENLFPGSLITSKNTRGKNIPLFWVFQNYEEFDALANALGHNQPVYGLKSYSSVIPVKEYSHQSIQGLVDRYLWEILALPVKQPIVMGGNCQGGMIALEIARKLSKTGMTPELLVLMEWMYKFGEYKKPTLFLYGEDSHTAGIFENNERSLGWQECFPSHELCKITGTHGEFFRDSNITSLATTLGSRLAELNRNNN